MNLQSDEVSFIYKSITIGYKYNLDCCSFISLFLRSLPHGGSLTLYSSPWTILTLHLLIIWALTWVPIPSDILFGFLWVVVAKAALFRGLLHINAAKRVVAIHSCNGSSFPLDIYVFPSSLYVYDARPYHWCFLEGYLNYQDTHWSCF